MALPPRPLSRLTDPTSPTVSVCIATWNRARLLDRVLESLTQLRASPALRLAEILVCDNNSTDDTRRVVEGFADRLSTRYTFEERQGKSFAIERLIADAQGDWILFLDDDVRVDPGILAAYAQAMSRYPLATAFGGQVLPDTDWPVRGVRGWLLKEFPNVHAVCRLAEDVNAVSTGRSGWGLNMLLRRDALVAAGGVDVARGMFGGKRVAGEDVALFQGQIDQGHDAWLIAHAKVSHYIPLERSGLRWYYRWNYGVARARALTLGESLDGGIALRPWLWRFMMLRTLELVAPPALRPYVRSPKKALKRWWRGPNSDG